MKTAETMTDSEIREELAAEGVDLDAAKSRFMPKLDEMMQARAVRLALAALKANPPHEQSPLPWYGCQFTGVLRDGDSNELADSLTVNDSLHIAAAVNAAPVLVAEVERLQCTLVAQAKRAGLPVDQLRHDDLAEHLADRIAELEAQCAAARVAVEKIGGFYHRRACATEVFLPCNCGAAASNAARTEARRALGLE